MHNIPVGLDYSQRLSVKKKIWLISLWCCCFTGRSYCADGSAGLLCSMLRGGGKCGGLHFGTSWGRWQSAKGSVNFHGWDVGNGLHSESEFSFLNVILKLIIVLPTCKNAVVRCGIEEMCVVYLSFVQLWFPKFVWWLGGSVLAVHSVHLLVVLDVSGVTDQKLIPTISSHILIN